MGLGWYKCQSAKSREKFAAARLHEAERVMMRAAKEGDIDASKEACSEYEKWRRLRDQARMDLGLPVIPDAPDAGGGK